MRNITIAAPICQKEPILREYLQSLEALDHEDCSISYIFADDGQPGNLLQDFAARHPNTILLDGEGDGHYVRSEKTHHWQEALIWKVARLKDRILGEVRQRGFDYVFFVDSDLVLQPPTLLHLLRLEKDIVAEVYWTKWSPDEPALPQVWLGGQYRLFARVDGEVLTEQEAVRRQCAFLRMLRQPGLYPVGGLGACTLISRRAVMAGVSFARIDNLDLVGEDRHFCVRAAVLGFELFADTAYPPFHIYRESELGILHAQRTILNATRPPLRGKITLAMLVRNEADRFLERVLRHAAGYVDHIVVLDDASTDTSAEICRQAAGSVPLTLLSNALPAFANEITLRKQLWDLAVNAGNEWILILDADELFEDEIAAAIRNLIAHEDCDAVCFRLYDMWTETQYRDDRWWRAHHVYRPFLVRYRDTAAYTWHETPQHCGRFPCNLSSARMALSDIRLRHLGWQRAADRITKYERYSALDPKGCYGSREQYESILDPQPHLCKW